MKKVMCIMLQVLFVVPSIQAASTPSVVLILADDMGIGDVSALNPNAKIKTPAIDRLVQEGVRFVDAHTASAVCTPTRYGLLTGRYCWRTRLKSRVLNGYSPCLIDKDRSTLATVFNRRGYATALIGKWHLGLGWTTRAGDVIQYEGQVSPVDEAQIDFSKPIQHGPVDLGFDYFYGVSASWDFPPYVFIQNRQVTVLPTRKAGGRLRPVSQEELSLVAAAKNEKETKRARDAFPKMSWRPGLAAPEMKVEDAVRIITDKTVAYLETQSADSPFFLYMSLTAPHTPVVPRASFLGKSRCGSYGDFVMEVDDAVRQVYQTLQKKGLLENTILIFTADNGASLKGITSYMQEKYDHSPSFIYSGFKARLEEGGHRVPFVLSWPSRLQGGQVCETPICLNDLYATFSDLLGHTRRDDEAEDSFSFMAQLQSPDAENPHPDRVLVHHDFTGNFAVRKGDWKLLLKKPKAQFRDDPQPPLNFCLYNLSQDPSEKQDLYHAKPAIVQQLMQALNQAILKGRTSAGRDQNNDGPLWWPQINWIDQQHFEAFYPLGTLTRL